MKKNDEYYQDLTAYLDSWCKKCSPALSSLPHLVFPCESENLKRILAIIGRKGIPLNTTCLEDFCPDESCSEDEFAEGLLEKWRTSDYQRKLCEEAWRAMGDEQFVLDAWTSREDLQQTARVKPGNFELELFLVANLNRYRWLFCSTSMEISAAIFVIRPDFAFLVEEIRKKFDNLRIPNTYFIRRKNRDVLYYDS